MKKEITVKTIKGLLFKLSTYIERKELLLSYGLGDKKADSLYDLLLEEKYDLFAKRFTKVELNELLDFIATKSVNNDIELSTDRSATEIMSDDNGFDADFEQACQEADTMEQNQIVSSLEELETTPNLPITESIDNIEMKQEAKEIAQTVSKYNLTIEHTLNGQMVETMATNKGYNLADFVYQIVLKYNEINEQNVPIAKTVEIDELETTEATNDLFNRIPDIYECVETIDTNIVQILHNNYSVEITDTGFNYHISFVDEKTHKEEVYIAIGIPDVLDYIDQKIN